MEMTHFIWSKYEKCPVFSGTLEDCNINIRWLHEEQFYIRAYKDYPAIWEKEFVLC